MKKDFDKATTCAFTGHRPEKLSFEKEQVLIWLENVIRRSVDDGYKYFFSGMQRGVDLWAAEVILRVKDEGKDIHLIAAVAFHGMENDWIPEWKEIYNRVLTKADDVVYVSQKPGKEAFVQRDHYMVDRSSRLIAVYSGVGGGTEETIEYGKKQGIGIVMYSD